MDYICGVRASCNVTDCICESGYGDVYVNAGDNYGNCVGKK